MKLKKQDLLGQVFDLADTNGDQALTREEFAVFGPQPSQILFRFAKLDTDHNQFISEEEFLAAPWRHHRRHK